MGIFSFGVLIMHIHYSFLGLGELGVEEDGISCNRSTNGIGSCRHDTWHMPISERPFLGTKAPAHFACHKPRPSPPSLGSMFFFVSLKSRVFYRMEGI